MGQFTIEWRGEGMGRLSGGWGQGRKVEWRIGKYWDG